MVLSIRRYILQNNQEIYHISHNHGNWKLLYLRPKYYWRAPRFTSMIVGGRVGSGFMIFSQISPPSISAPSLFQVFLDPPLWARHTAMDWILSIQELTLTNKYQHIPPRNKTKSLNHHLLQGDVLVARRIFNFLLSRLSFSMYQGSHEHLTVSQKSSHTSSQAFLMRLWWVANLWILRQMFDWDNRFSK